MDHVNNKLSVCSFITGDFNAMCSKLCIKDITNSVGHETDTIILSAGYNQFINKPTDIVNNLSSCIDPIFCNKVNLISNCSVDFSIVERCHHNIIFGKINIPLPPSYVCETWDYSSANSKNIAKYCLDF